jgi:hypothetical protein
MHFDEWNSYTQQCIAQSNACVCKCTRVNDNKIDAIFSSIMDALDQFVFSITLLRI